MTEKSTDVTRRLFSRRAFTATAAAAAAIAPFVAASQANAAPAEKTAGTPGDVRRITLYAEKLPDGQLATPWSPASARSPAPSSR